MSEENTIFCGRPNYTGPTIGWFAALHHSILVEWSYNVMERVGYVSHEKPKHERATRLWNMMYIGEHGAAYDEASLPARAAYAEAIRPAKASYYEAMRTAEAAYDEAMRTAMAAYHEKMRTAQVPVLSYIRQHIPDFPWDEAEGVMIFPEAK